LPHTAGPAKLPEASLQASGKLFTTDNTSEMHAQTKYIVMYQLLLLKFNTFIIINTKS